jgi:hypothetical protein
MVFILCENASTEASEDTDRLTIFFMSRERGGSLPIDSHSSI